MLIKFGSIFWLTQKVIADSQLTWKEKKTIISIPFYETYLKDFFW